MSKLAAAVSALVERLESYEARLDALTAQVTALETALTEKVNALEAATATATAETTAKVAALDARLVKATTADVGFDLVPIRDEATIALAEYRRQLDDFEFEPEGDGVTSAMRAEHHAAMDAVDRAASWIGRSGETRDKEIYAAIGAGRKALIRLRAMSENEPVPLSLLTDDELSGYLSAETDVHTEDRFCWEGDGNVDLLLDRPVFGKPVFVEVVGSGDGRSRTYVTKVQRTDRVLKDSGERIFYDEAYLYREMMDPKVTHLRIASHTAWRARVVQFDELPPMEHTTTGREEAMFRHTLGGKTVTIQGTDSGAVLFVPECDCTDACTKYGHATFATVAAYEGAFREDLTLPAGTGMLYMRMDSVWSMTVLDD